MFEPSVALGLSVVHPFLAGIRGGLALPVTATAGLDIAGDVALGFQPGGGLTADEATVTAPLSFSVVATPRLFAQLSALGGILSPPAWQSDNLAELPLFEDRKLLEVVFDLAHPDRGITVHRFDPTAPASSSPTPLVPTAVARGWNEHGDRRVAPRAPVARPPFTLYDPSNRVGYKALVVHPGGVIDEIAWSRLRAIAAARALHDGTPVAAVRIVFPRRDDALRFHARAIADGFEMAMYPDRGVFWEVYPPQR